MTSHSFRSLSRLALAAACIAYGATAEAQSPGTTVQLPTFGVAVDAEGVLRVKEVRDPGGRLLAARIAAARRELPADVAAPTKLRYVSLNRLEAAIAKNIAAGKPVDDVMQNLAGLQRVQYVMCLPASRDSQGGGPESGEVVLAGPAEGWVDNGAGQTVGVNNGRPTLQLEDLLVALRMFPPGRADKPFVGCTIDPTPAGLKRMQAFQRKVPNAVPQNARARVALQLAAGMREALGMAKVRVFGVPAETQMAKVLIEADYRMKLIGIGLESAPVKMVTFIGALNSARNGALQRWWFTPNYECVRVADDRLAMELVGQGVRLQSEDKVIGPGGKLLNERAVPNKASDMFVASFTEKYEAIAAREPVFAQMRNCIDLLVAAAFLQREDFYGRTAWDARVLLSERQLPTRTHNTPRKAPCAANSLWKGNRLLTPAGGGVSILPHRALSPERVLKDDGSVAKLRRQTSERLPEDRWWWD